MWVCKRTLAFCIGLVVLGQEMTLSIYELTICDELNWIELKWIELNSRPSVHVTLCNLASRSLSNRAYEWCISLQPYAYFSIRLLDSQLYGNFGCSATKIYYSQTLDCFLSLCSSWIHSVCLCLLAILKISWSFSMISGFPPLLEVLYFQNDIITWSLYFLGYAQIRAEFVSFTSFRRFILFLKIRYPFINVNKYR